MVQCQSFPQDLFKLRLLVTVYLDILVNLPLLLVDINPSAVLRQRELLKVLYRSILICFAWTISHIITIINIFQ